MLLNKKINTPLPALVIDQGLGISDLGQDEIELARKIGAVAAKLEPLEAAHRLGSLYGALLPREMRSRLGVFYTPPPLVKRMMDLVSRAGHNWSTGRVLDPACGGGAFLAPVARRIADEMSGHPPMEVLASIERRVKGIELDGFAAWMSQVHVETAVMDVCRRAGRRLGNLVEIADTLLKEPDPQPGYDLVIGNPPYRKVPLTASQRLKFFRSVSGHANLYALFADFALRAAKPGGLISLLTPASLLGGWYFRALRELLATEATPLSFDFVWARGKVFDDAIQETVLALFRRRKKKPNSARKNSVAVNFLTKTKGPFVGVTPGGRFSLPSDPRLPWVFPRSKENAPLAALLGTMPNRLSDYGYKVRTGPFVWNRRKDQLRNKNVRGSYPLLWAETITLDGQVLFPRPATGRSPFIRLGTVSDKGLLVSGPCVLTQRTTNREQNRRLIAAELPPWILKKFGEVAVENHVNIIFPMSNKPLVAPSLLAALLNTPTVDQAFRCVNGSSAVSAFELETLPLPDPFSLLRAVSRHIKKNDQKIVNCTAVDLFWGKNENDMESLN